MSDAVAAFSILAWSAYVLSRVAKRRSVPELVAFLLAGALLGPSGLEVVTDVTLAQLRIATQLALAVLMFVIGERVSMRALRSETSVVLASVFQFVATAAAVGVAVYAAGARAELALLLAVLAGAGAPMTVSAVITERRARGRFADGVVSAHAVSDALAAVFFAAALPVAALWLGSGGGTAEALSTFGRIGAGSIALGIAAGAIVARMGAQIETSGELLLFSLVHILATSTVALALGVSLPLTALVMGATAASLAPSEAGMRLFVAVRSIEQPLYLLFFALAGASIHVDALPELGVIGLAYAAVRGVTKVAAGTVGAALTKTPLRSAFRLGTSLVPQAGVAVGLAVLAAEELPDVGADVAAVVLGSVVIFELIGPLVVSRNLTSETDSEDGDGEGLPADSGDAPSVVLVASAGAVVVPEWLLSWCARVGAELVAMGSTLAEDPTVTDLRARAASELVDFRWLGFGGESFAGAVTRAASEVRADLVVVATPTPHGASRLSLLPHERIGRQLRCPLLLLPTRTSVASPAPSGPR